MDFDFTEEQDSLREAVRRWADRGFGFERRQGVARAGGHTRAVHAELAELGLTALAIPEAQGGMGLGPVEAMLVMEELGRGLVTAPYAHAALMAPALLAAAPAGLQAAWLPRMAEGSALVMPALQEHRARYRIAHVATRARTESAGGAVAEEASANATGWRLEGAKSVVPAGDEADAFIVPARVAGAEDDAQGIALFLVEAGAPGVALRAYPTQDGARAAELSLADAPATLIAAEGHALLEQAVDIGIAAACAEGVGLMDRLLELTFDYMKTRRQFGVPIASFQALRHRAADLKMQLELGRSMSYYATLKLGAPRETRRHALSQAKVQLGRSMRFVGQECIQLHGGIGVTDACMASHCFKRLTMLELAFGDTLHHLGEVSAGMQDTAGVFA